MIEQYLIFVKLINKKQQSKFYEMEFNKPQYNFKQIKQ
jgi:hypothetical protein